MGTDAGEAFRMEKAEFDRFADEYDDQHAANIAVTGEAPDYFARYKIRVLRAQAIRRGVPFDSLLDFGSGIGNSIPHFRELLPSTRLICSDVSQRSLDLARTRFGDPIQALLIDGRHIPIPDNSVAIAFSACVFHHIPHEEHVSWLAELRRVVRPGGLISIFEHNPLNPLTVHAVKTCPFDINARLIRAGALAERFQIAGWREPCVAYHVFFPRLLSALRGLEPSLSRIPLGAQYSVTAIKQT